MYKNNCKDKKDFGGICPSVSLSIIRIARNWAFMVSLFLVDDMGSPDTVS